MQRFLRKLWSFSFLRSTPYMLTKEQLRNLQIYYDRPIATGGFGMIFSGKMNGSIVVVKRVELESIRVEKMVLKFCDDEHLLPMLAYFLDNQNPDDAFLVSSFMSNSSVSIRLYEIYAEELSDFHTRVDIAFGVAKGLAELHEHGIIHRDIKPANIFLTSNFKSKIGDFGLSLRVKNDPAMRSESDGIAGTRAYLPEEYKECGLLTKSVDTFAFGILIFELITGQRPCNELRPKWLRGEHMQMDSRIVNGDLKCIDHLWEIGQKCTKRNYKDRQSMKISVENIHKITTAAKVLKSKIPAISN